MSYGTVLADQIQNTTGYSLGAGDASLMKNRIINGAMVVDQRNLGASITPTTNPTYTVDRWFAAPSSASKFSVQQTTTAPAGFSYSLKMTSLAATSVGATDYYEMYQAIEGYNIADLGWGTANPKTVTLSFWVQSSLTGTFGGTFLSGDIGATYPFTYTISSANTWTQISVTVTGPTTYNFGTTNGVGFYVGFNLGAGASVSGTAGAWTGSFIRAPSSTVQVVATNLATLYITGIQLEVGSTANGFEYRQYQQELALCQRYFFILQCVDSSTVLGSGYNDTTTAAAFFIKYPVTMRTSPTITISSLKTYGVNSTNISSISSSSIGTDTARLYGALSGSVTAGQGCLLAGQSSSSYLNGSAEL